MFALLVKQSGAESVFFFASLMHGRILFNR
jgi:hypothetical protein